MTTTNTNWLNDMISESLPLKHRVIHSIMQNFPEASGTMRCTHWDYDNFQFEFLDEEEGKKHVVTLPKLEKAFRLLKSDKWCKGLTQVPCIQNWESWENWLCQADALDFEAFVQLAVFGEVIYG